MNNEKLILDQEIEDEYYTDEEQEIYNHGYENGKSIVFWSFIIVMTVLAIFLEILL